MTKKKTNETQPRLLVFAGPNGSGKSTIIKCVEIQGLYINADEIKCQNEKLTDLEAAIEAEVLREYCLRAFVDFSFETVLSTERNLDLISRAKSAGYYIDCCFVLTADPELNVFRVNTRVSQGGHSVPADKIRLRYKKSLANIPSLIPLCSRIRIVDNTFEPYVIYLKDSDGREVISENIYWPQKKITELVYR